MTRTRYRDYLQDHRFWMFDISPSSAFPFLVLGAPFLGFQTLTVPEYTAEVETLKQLNSMFKIPVYSGGEVGSITLTRGVRGWDGSMWNWMHNALSGYETTRRDLLIIHYSNINMADSPGLEFMMDPTGISGFIPSDIWASGSFLPGKVYVLLGAIPTRYKPASDFDATSGQVSISELDIQAWAMAEISAMSPL